MYSPVTAGSDASNAYARPAINMATRQLQLYSFESCCVCVCVPSNKRLFKGKKLQLITSGSSRIDTGLVN